MSTKANWYVGDVLPALDEEPDPFAMPIEEVGERIDLVDPGAANDLRLRELFRHEASLARMGVTCGIKDRTDTTCHACPISRAHVPEEMMSKLCRVGREQERLSTEGVALAYQREQAANGPAATS